jgi:hypothetical protein
MYRNGVARLRLISGRLNRQQGRCHGTGIAIVPILRHMVFRRLRGCKAYNQSTKKHASRD